MVEQSRSKQTAPELRTGAPVETDTGMTGTITEVLADFPDAEGGVRVAWDGAHATVVPRRALVVEHDHIVVRTDTETRTVETENAGRAVVGSEAMVVPVIEEVLTTETPWREAGTVTLHLRTEETPETVEEYVTREELEIAEVAVGRVLADGEVPAQRQEGETLIIPVIEERLVMVKQRVLVKEMRVSKRSQTESRQVTEMVRRQRVEFDGGDLADRVSVRGTDPAHQVTDAEETASPAV